MATDGPVHSSTVNFTGKLGCQREEGTSINRMDCKCITSFNIFMRKAWVFFQNFFLGISLCKKPQYKLNGQSGSFDHWFSSHHSRIYRNSLQKSFLALIRKHNPILNSILKFCQFHLIFRFHPSVNLWKSFGFSSGWS